jgi:hypothetical protein
LHSSVVCRLLGLEIPRSAAAFRIPAVAVCPPLHRGPQDLYCPSLTPIVLCKAWNIVWYLCYGNLIRAPGGQGRFGPEPQ